MTRLMTRCGGVVIVWGLVASGISLAAPPPVADTLTEGTAALWGAEAQSASAAVYDDTARVKVGSSSVRFETDGGFDTWLWAPQNQLGGWNLSAAASGGVGFWVYALNETHGFQSLSPWVRFCTTPWDYYEYKPNYDVLNEARNQWLWLEVPLNGDDLWSGTVVGEPTLLQINYIEIHADTWDAGFTLWFDGLTFDVSLAPPRQVLAVAGNHQVALQWQPWNDFAGLFDHYAIYRSTAPFNDTTGMTPIHTIDAIGTAAWVDTTPANGTGYYYAVTAVLTSGAETTSVDAVGPRVPRSETDLQVTSMARLPRFPRYAPEYAYYEVTEPSGFGPYGFSAATGLGGGQTAETQRWPDVGDPVTYQASVRNRGTNVWAGTLTGTWTLDGSAISTPAQAVSLAPGDVTTFEVVVNWDGALHDIAFALDVTDARAENNARSLGTLSAPFLTYVDIGALEDFRDRLSPQYPLAATDDLIDWLWRHAERMNAMFAEQGSQKRVHYDVLEVIHDYDPDPDIERIPFAIFPFRYYGATIGDPRSPGYYQADVDIDNGLCHEMSHQLGLIDLYRLDVAESNNYVSGQGYWATQGMMHGCSSFYSEHSARAMDHWLDKAHGYYGQYLYALPDEVHLRVVGLDGQPVQGAAIKMYQKCERPGLGEVITTQIKAQGTTDADGIWVLPNVPIDPALVPTTFAGDTLHDNPFGYVAVVGNNGVLLFRIEYEGVVEYAWLEITEVNNAYWAGQTQVATIERQIPAYGAIQHYPPADMTELNAANWDAWAGYTATITLADDLTQKHVGAGALQITTDGAGDNYVQYPVGLVADWDLSAVDQIRFWAYTPTAYHYTSYSPWVRIGNADGYIQWLPTASGPKLDEARGHWHEFAVPIYPEGGDWTISVSGGITDLEHINYIEIHADPTGTGFQLWLDGVRFDPQPAEPCAGDVNCDGIVDYADIDPFVEALTCVGGTGWSHDCPWLSGDCNGDGDVTYADIDPFVGRIGATCP